ncbi:hypothetical protein NEMBOFW57_008538 [Staphylotrichum longicolle]|uniref:Uncharacterized protein n=1 Tax=Staphylotrichum longicolle TaxID=669026 RepID=A0AAD4HVY2_9PEZI|nr:hypothetical protein NEMBOFW57_008538 [Staphylotrichum longicolle]
MAVQVSPFEQFVKFGTDAWRSAAQHWLDFASKSFTGVYLLLESLTFVEVALDVPPEIGVWGTQAAVGGLVADGQRFWFAGLVCGVLAGGMRLVGGDGNGM